MSRLWRTDEQWKVGQYSVWAESAKITTCAEAELFIGMIREYFGTTQSPFRSNTKLKDMQDQAHTLHWVFLESLALGTRLMGMVTGAESAGGARVRSRQLLVWVVYESATSVQVWRTHHYCGELLRRHQLSRMPAWNMVLSCLHPGIKVILNQNCNYIHESFSRSNQFSWSKKSFSLNLRAGFYNFPNFCETLCSHSSKKFSFYLFECEERIEILFHNSASSHFLSSLNSTL